MFHVPFLFDEPDSNCTERDVGVFALDHLAHPTQTLAQTSGQRWEIELGFRGIRQEADVEPQGISFHTAQYTILNIRHSPVLTLQVSCPSNWRCYCQKGATSSCRPSAPSAAIPKSSRAGRANCDKKSQSGLTDWHCPEGAFVRCSIDQAALTFKRQACSSGSV